MAAADSGTAHYEVIDSVARFDSIDEARGLPLYTSSVLSLMAGSDRRRRTSPALHVRPRASGVKRY